mgnify:CR=1 FL=1
MANLGVTGGIGAGIMQGLQFMRQREGDARQEQALANQTELLGMQKQLHGEKMGELNRANEERMRTDALGALSTNVESVYSDLPAYQRQQMVIDNGLKAGLFKPADLEAAKSRVDGMRKAFGPDAYDALMRGDIRPAQGLLKSKGIDLQADAKTPGAYIIRSPGSDVPQTVTHAGLLQLDAMSGAYEREQARAAAELGRRKTEAEIQEKTANANLKDRLPQLNLGAGARGAGGKDPQQAEQEHAMRDATAGHLAGSAGAGLAAAARGLASEAGLLLSVSCTSRLSISFWLSGLFAPPPSAIAASQSAACSASVFGASSAMVSNEIIPDESSFLIAQ